MEKSKTIIALVDSSIEIEVVKNFIVSNPSTKIISFDFDSHVMLKTFDIEHKISDIFLTNDDLTRIQNSAYVLSEWFDENQLKKYVYYDEINLGKLFYEEILDFMIQFLKKFEEVRIISESYSNSSFLASKNLFEISSSFSNNCSQFEQSQSKSFQFTHDKVRYNFKIGNKHFIFYISRNTFLKLKTMSERFIHFLFGPKKNMGNHVIKNTLLVEFNTVRFSEFILNGKDSNLFYYGRRRPAIWNLDSFKTMKNSNCKIFTETILKDKKLDKKIQEIFPIIQSKIDSMWNLNFFSDFFQISNITIWNIIKPTFVNLFRNRLGEILLEVELAKNLFKNYHFDNILVFSEIGLTEQIITKLGKKYNIPIMLLQIGLHIDSLEAQQMNRSKSVYPENTNKFFVWGKIYAQDAEFNAKIKKEKIIPLGSPRFDNLELSNKNDSKYILLATSGPQQEDIHGLVIGNIEKYENTIKQICKTVSKHHKLVIKLHPSAKEHDVTKIVKKIDPNIVVVTTGDIQPLIQSCSMMICMGLSTSILEAQLFGKPVILIPVIDYNWGEPEVFRSQSCLISNIEKLSDNIEKILIDSKFRNNLIQQGNNFVANCLENKGTASKEIWNFLIKN